jgi:CxxC motif-containing protein
MTAAKNIVTKRYLPVLEAQLKTVTVMAEENIPNRKLLTLIDLQVNFP